MTAIATFPVLLDTGDHASRPAASAVGKGALYSCTTHQLIYQTDGSSWSTWATLASGSGAPTTAPYVTTAADGGLSAEIVRPHLGNFFRESNGYGAGTGTDEFADASFSGWTLTGTGHVSGDHDEATYPGFDVMTIPSGRNATQVAYKAGYTGGDFALEAKLSVQFSTRTDTSMWGIQITDSSGNGVAACLHGSASATASAFYLRNVAAHADSSGLTSGATDFALKQGQPVYLRLEKASGVYTARLSFNGITWESISGTPSAFTVARIAFGRTFHAGTATQVGVFDYLRSSA